MYEYKVYFRKNKIEYCGGQNQANSRKYQLQANIWRGNEFEYFIGEIDNKTLKFTKGKDYGELPEEQVKRLIDIASK